MKLIIIPFNDFKKGEHEGFRVRDNRFMEFIIDSSDLFERILIVDRPVSLLTTILRGTRWSAYSGEVVRSGPNWKLKRIKNNVFILDYIQFSLIAPLLQGRTWWNGIYRSKPFTDLVRSIQKYLGMDEAEILLHHPFGMNLVEKIPFRHLIFDVVDNFLKIEYFARISNEMRVEYDKILANAQFISSVSEDAKRNLFKNSDKVIVIPNGVTPKFFEVPLKHHNVKSLKRSKKTRIVYVGTLAPQRIDVNLIRQIACSYQTGDFFLVGPMVNPSYFRPLRNLSNVFLERNVHYDYLPSILSDSDICMIPHKTSGYEMDGDLQKFYEYIAAGKPVVSTRVLGVDRFSKHFAIVDNAVQFQYALDNWKEKKFKVDYPKDLLSGRTWDDRVSQLLSLISELR